MMPFLLSWNKAGWPPAAAAPRRAHQACRRRRRKPQFPLCVCVHQFIDIQ